MKTTPQLKIIVLFVLLGLLSVASLIAQNKTCDCLTDLQFLEEKLQKSKAYKIDYRGKKGQFSAKAEAIKKDATSTMPVFDCYLKLQEMLALVNDNHNYILGTQYFTGKLDSIDLDQVKKETYFNYYPKFEGNLDSLETVLQRHGLSAEEGIYAASDNLRLGIFQTKKTKLAMVVLQSNLPLWSRGEILGELLPKGNQYEAVMGLFSSKRLVTVPVDLKEGQLLMLGLTKENAIEDVSRDYLSQKDLFLDEIDSHTQYLRVASFNSFYPFLTEAEKFYDSITRKLTAKNLVLDLRHNRGGGDRNSNILKDLLEDYLKEGGNLYVMIDFGTSSNGEQFAVKLAEEKNVTLIGDRTNGQIAYEINGGSFDLPSGLFKGLISKKLHRKFLMYETVGVKPDIYLDYKTPWMEQVAELLKSSEL
ncbi:MAG: S41 family peptidase [Leeuwenhoekiella sp.]